MTVLNLSDLPRNISGTTGIRLVIFRLQESLEPEMLVRTLAEAFIYTFVYLCQQLYQDKPMKAHWIVLYFSSQVT